MKQITSDILGYVLCVKCNLEKEDKKQCKHCQKAYRLANKDKIKQYKIEYCKNNKEKIAEGNKKYYHNNYEKIRKLNNIYYNKRCNSDPSFKLRKICSNRIYQTLRNIRGNKGGSILKYLPYTIQELKEHLEKQFEPWMNWDNYGLATPNKKTWQIDHIIPQSKLPYLSMEDDNFKKCWALENLRPLEAFENIKKSNK